MELFELSEWMALTPGLQGVKALD